MGAKKLLETAAIYARWGWLSVRDPIERATIARRLARGGPVSIRMHSPGLGLFAHFSWCLYLAGWAEKNGRQIRLECTSPNYGHERVAHDWLPEVLEYRSQAPKAGAARITLRRWEFMPYSANSAVPVALAEARALFRRHFIVPQALVRQAGEFAAANFRDDFLVGVHYRGTDKHIEASRTDYNDAIASVNETCRALDAAGVRAVTVFVATDEKGFAEDIRRRVTGARVAMIDEALRSECGKALHAAPSKDGVRKAREAVVDVLLLGKTRLLIKTASTLSAWAPIIGNDMPVLSLSKPFERCNWFPDAIIARAAFHRGGEGNAVQAALSAFAA